MIKVEGGSVPDNELDYNEINGSGYGDYDCFLDEGDLNALIKGYEEREKERKRKIFS